MKVWDDSSPYDFNWSPQKFRRLAAEHDERARRARADGDIDDASREARKAIDCRQTARGKEWLDDPSPPATPAPEPAAAPAVGEGEANGGRQTLAAAFDDWADGSHGYGSGRMRTAFTAGWNAALPTPAPAAGLVTAEMVGHAIDVWMREWKGQSGYHALSIIVRNMLTIALASQRETAALSARQEGGA